MAHGFSQEVLVAFNASGSRMRRHIAINQLFAGNPICRACAQRYFAQSFRSIWSVAFWCFW
jgi:hypothetical protein